MIEQTFNILQQAFNELNDEENLHKLQNIEQRYNDKLYFVAFVGQFSAGKSSLLNNLINRKILPQGTVETTPILTYIRYSDVEKAVLFLTDGTESEIDVEDVDKIMQQGSKIKDINVNDIEHMEIYINSDLLRNGMILLDTPGINTLIEKHEHLLGESLSLASSIVYVTSSTPSKLDADKLAEMIKHGFPLSFVRTRCDEINESEGDSYEKVRSDDIKIIKSALSDSEYTLDENSCFHISNLSSSPYFSKIETIKNMLESKGNDVEKSLSEDTKLQLDVLCQAALAELKKMRDILYEKKNNQTEELQKRKAKLDNDIALLSEKLQKRRQHLENEVNNNSQKVRDDLKNYIDKTIVNAKEKITNLEVQTNDEMNLSLQKETRLLLQNIINKINSSIDPLIRDINGEFNTNEIEIAFTEMPEVENYSTIVNYQNEEIAQLEGKIKNLQRNRQQIEEWLTSPENLAQLTKTKEDVAELEKELISLKAENDNMVYEPQMIEVEGTQTGANIGKTIGNVLDWALMFIPATAAVSAAKKVGLAGKLAKATTSLGKYGTAIAKGISKGKSLQAVISNVKNVSKSYATAKRIAKVADVMLKVPLALDKAKAVAPPSMLDYFTIEHWGEQLGKQFDTPPHLEEDKIYRANFEASKRQMTNEIVKKQQQVYNLKVKNNLFRTKQEQEKARLDSLKVNENELKRKLESKKTKLKAEAKEQALSSWKNAWADYYCQKLRTQLESHVDSYIDELPERLIAYQAKRFDTLQKNLTDKKDEYNKLINMPPNEIDEKFQRTNNIIKMLESN